jgi:hypothetical protein
MLRQSSSLKRTSISIYRFYSSSQGANSLRIVDTICSRLDAINIHEFRDRAFLPEKPVLISTRNGSKFSSAYIRLPNQSLPAAYKWFCTEAANNGVESVKPSPALALSQQYLSAFGDTILPYELHISSKDEFTRPWLRKKGAVPENGDVAFLANMLENSEGTTFHRFYAPLSLFLEACRLHTGSHRLERLYIAQAQIADLPKQLQDDLPTPRLVKEAGKGDVYDANIWMGIPPTYTPLHKDPNPNLFVQLGSSKRVRIFRPQVGRAIFFEVEQKIGQYSSPCFRGDEMMEGPERDALDKSVWGEAATKEGLEATVGPGDALFIPKGWWHSIKSIGTDLNASVNWWFR